MERTADSRTRQKTAEARLILALRQAQDRQAGIVVLGTSQGRSWSDSPGEIDGVISRGKCERVVVGGGRQV